MIDEKQEAIVAAISARPNIAAAITANRARVVSAVKGQIANDIAAALGKLRLLIVVEPVVSNIGYDRDVPVLRTTTAITIFENVLLNRVGEGYLTNGGAQEEILFALRPSAGLHMIPVRGTLQDSLTKLLQYTIECEGRIILQEPPPAEEEEP